MLIDPGEFRHKITIMKDGEKDSRGFNTTPVVVKERIKAKVSKNRNAGKEIEAGGTEINVSPVRFLIRKPKTPIDTMMYVVYKDKEYDIENVNDLGEEGRYLEIFAKVRE